MDLKAKVSITSDRQQARIKLQWLTIIILHKPKLFTSDMSNRGDSGAMR